MQYLKNIKPYFNQGSESKMATVSFDKNFVIEDKESSDMFLRAMSTPRKVVTVDKDLKAENSKGLSILARRFSNSQKS